MPKRTDYDLIDADVSYYPNFFGSHESNNYFEKLLKNTIWQQDDITVFGKTYKQPRLTAFYAQNTLTYSYSNITMTPYKFNADLRAIKKRVETVCAVKFTSCLLNLYRDGQDSNGWHADNEKALGQNPVIASVSFGAERIFHLKHRQKPDQLHKINLEHGSLLIMKGPTQHNWLHQIPKTKKDVGKRINLTFRVIK